MKYPYSIRTLSERWDCHPDVVRRLVKSGALQSFRVGALIRIAWSEVERYECSGSGLPDTGAGSSLNGMTKASDTDERCARETWRQRTPKLVTLSAPSNAEKQEG